MAELARKTLSILLCVGLMPPVQAASVAGPTGTVAEGPAPAAALPLAPGGLSGAEPALTSPADFLSPASLPSSLPAPPPSVIEAPSHSRAEASAEVPPGDSKASPLEVLRGRAQSSEDLGADLADGRMSDDGARDKAGQVFEPQAQSRTSDSAVEASAPGADMPSGLSAALPAGAALHEEPPPAQVSYDLAPEPFWRRALYYPGVLKNWVGQFFHNSLGVLGVLDILLLRPLGGGLLMPDHPWVTGIRPETGRPIWSENVVFSTPRRASWRKGWEGNSLDPEPDDVILEKVGGFMAKMVGNSASTLQHPYGRDSRMPHAVNYIHGSVHYNGGFLLFNDFQEAIYHLSDPAFVREIKRFARETRREVIFVFRERVYDPWEYAHFVGVARSVLPWFTNSNGPVRSQKNTVTPLGSIDPYYLIDHKVLWGNPSPYAAANFIDGHWKRDVFKLRRSAREPALLQEIVRPPIEKGRYFQDGYRGTRVTARWPEILLAKVTDWRLKWRRKLHGRGNLFFIDERKFQQFLAGGRMNRYWEPQDMTEPVAIIGGGAAGLALAYELKRRGVESVVLERSGAPGSSWRNMPTNLHLLTPGGLNLLSDTIPDIDPREAYPSASRYARYLEDYASYHFLKVMTRAEVQDVEPMEDGSLSIRLAGGQRVRSRAVVNATGYYGNPFIPAIEGAAETPVRQMHVAEYKNPSQIASLLGETGKRVLIVGGRLSAGQTMEELEKAGFQVSLSARSPVRFMSSGLWHRIALRLLPFTEWLLRFLGPRSTDLPMEGGRSRDLIESGRVPVRPGIARFDGSEVVFTDGARERFDLVLYATGFRPALGHLSGLTAMDPQTGLPRLDGMASADVPGLYFLGLDGQRDFRSRFLRGIRSDAKVLAKRIARDLRRTEPPP